MNEAVLQHFRDLADAMADARGDGPRDWQWNGPHMSQQFYGITQARAEGYARAHGGTARRMDQ